MKLLNLILYSETIPEYVEMKHILETYLDKLYNFKYYFYCYNENIQTEYEIKGNTIYIKGRETYIPGILKKTIKVFEICNRLQIEYDYIVRSNISTIINFPSLQAYILAHKNDKLDFLGSEITLKHINELYGITRKYINTHICWGICMIFSHKIIKLLLDNIYTLDYTLMDDIAISVLLQKYNIPFHNLSSLIKENSDTFYYSKIIFRNKSNDRYNDINRITLLIDKLIHNLTIQNML